MGLRGIGSRTGLYTYPFVMRPRLKRAFTCHECGSEFMATRPDARTCGDRCRQRQCLRRKRLSQGKKETSGAKGPI
jgi:hypothetical protein